MLIYEGDDIHRFKATELSYVMIVVTFVSSFISFLERCIEPSVQLENANRKPWLREERKNEEIISRKCLQHHKRASNFTNTHKAALLYLLPMLSRYYGMSDCVQRDGSRDLQKRNPWIRKGRKNEEIICRHCLSYHKKARTFVNKHKAVPLHLLPMLSRYYAMNESM
jgi:uncharacterized Fe-S cluster protein YjdI